MCADSRRPPGMFRTWKAAMVLLIAGFISWIVGLYVSIIVLF